ncbi:hypothetical protein [uncultured Microscilla sp.]|uniref:hypothetical protein n=1 Tax=uncultured Microscilla sp. TaxID=432653 RepID=UPI00262AD9C1|nr:hypothetical protein [uncultured Microscilla sp.]
MDILKTSIEWAKDEVFSSAFFVLFGIMFVLATIGFWQLGKTDIAKAFIFPTLVAGVLLLAIGLGLFFTNKSRITSFATAYNSDASAFIKSERARTKKLMAEYQTAVFKVIPFIIVIAALLIVFIDTPLWRAISITTIAMMAVILLVDSNAHARVEAYNKQLVTVEKDLKN